MPFTSTSLTGFSTRSATLLCMGTTLPHPQRKQQIWQHAKSVYCSMSCQRMRMRTRSQRLGIYLAVRMPHGTVTFMATWTWGTNSEGWALSSGGVYVSKMTCPHLLIFRITVEHESISCLGISCPRLPSNNGIISLEQAHILICWHHNL